MSVSHLINFCFPLHLVNCSSHQLLSTSSTCKRRLVNYYLRVLWSLNSKIKYIITNKNLQLTTTVPRPENVWVFSSLSDFNDITTKMKHFSARIRWDIYYRISRCFVIYYLFNFKWKNAFSLSLFLSESRALSRSLWQSTCDALSLSHTVTCSNWPALIKAYR